MIVQKRYFIDEILGFAGSGTRRPRPGVARADPTKDYRINGNFVPTDLPEEIFDPLRNHQPIARIRPKKVSTRARWNVQIGRLQSIARPEVDKWLTLLTKFPQYPFLKCDVFCSPYWRTLDDRLLIPEIDRAAIP